MAEKEKEHSPTEMAMVAKSIDELVNKSFGFDITRDGEGNANGLWDSEINAFIDTATLKALFFSEDWVFITLDLLANKISSQTMPVMHTTIEDDQEVTVEDLDHPLTLLLENPNQWQDYHSWMYNVVIELFLMGNAIIWHNKRLNNLVILPAEMVTLDFNEDGSVKQYMMGSATVDDQGVLLLNTDTNLSFPVDEIIHIRRPNPASLLWGLSPFIPGRKSILFNRYTADYLNAFYLKQATPALAISIDRAVNEDVALRQLRAMENAYTGRRNMRRTMVLPKGVTVQPLSHSLADQKLMDHINSNRETILGLLKIPKHEVALQTSGSLGSEEHKIALRNFWESTLKPAMRQIAGSFTLFFKDELGPDRFFQFDIDDVEALQEDKEQKADTAIKLLAAGWTINEVRELFEKEPSDHEFADIPKPLVPSNTAPSLGQFSAPLEQPRQDILGRILGDDELQLILNKAGTTLDLEHKSLDEELNRESNEFIRMILEKFVDLAEIAIREFQNVATELKGSDEWTSPTGIIHKAKDLQFKVVRVNSRELAKKIQRAFDNLEESYVDDSVRILESSVEFGYNTQLRFVFNEPGIDEITALRTRDARRRRLLLEARGLQSFKQITKTHTERIMKQIQEGVSKSETIDDITRRIASTFAEPDKIIGKARTIARTETLSAVSQGQWAAVKNAQEVIPNLKKIWITAGDERVRPSHTNNNGVELSVDEKFANGLRFPRDPQGSAGEVINCRCTLVMVPPDEEIGDIPEDLGAEVNPPSRSGRRRS